MEIPEFEEFFALMYPKLVRYAQRKVDPVVAEAQATAALQTIWTRRITAPGTTNGARTLQSFAYRMVDALIHEVDEAHWPVWGQPVSMTDRDVLALIVDGYTIAEIAVILNCKAGAVSVRLQRAKKNAKLLWAREVQRGQKA